jgi:hypothetical protein
LVTSARKTERMSVQCLELLCSPERPFSRIAVFVRLFDAYEQVNDSAKIRDMYCGGYLYVLFSLATCECRAK